MKKLLTICLFLFFPSLAFAYIEPVSSNCQNSSTFEEEFGFDYVYYTVWYNNELQEVVAKIEGTADDFAIPVNVGGWGSSFLFTTYYNTTYYYLNSDNWIIAPDTVEFKIVILDTDPYYQNAGLCFSTNSLVVWDRQSPDPVSIQGQEYEKNEIFFDVVKPLEGSDYNITDYMNGDDETLEFLNIDSLSLVCEEDGFFKHDFCEFINWLLIPDKNAITELFSTVILKIEPVNWFYIKMNADYSDTTDFVSSLDSEYSVIYEIILKIVPVLNVVIILVHFVFFSIISSLLFKIFRNSTTLIH